MLSNHHIKEIWRDLINEVNSIKVLVIDVEKDTALKLINSIDRIQVNGCITQVLPSDVVISDKQLILASLITFKSIREGFNVSKKPYIEFLVRLFANRQIRNVLENLKSVNGIKYYIIRVCLDVVKEDDIAVYGRKVPLEELMERVNDKCIKHISMMYELPEEALKSVKNISDLHLLILSKIALSVYIK